MSIVAEHEFIENQRGELVLLVNTLSDKSPNQPVFLVSPTKNTGVFYRDANASSYYEIIGINPNIIDRLRQINNILVIEMTGESIIHSYPATAGLFKENH